VTCGSTSGSRRQINLFQLYLQQYRHHLARSRARLRMCAKGPRQDGRGLTPVIDTDVRSRNSSKRRPARKAAGVRPSSWRSLLTMAPASRPAVQPGSMPPVALFVGRRPLKLLRRMNRQRMSNFSDA